MAPLHQPFDHHAVVNDDGHHDDAVFLPLDDRRWSDASDVSAYCIHPDDRALRRHPYQRLQPKKVAVIGTNARSIICASTLKQDGHQVTLLTPNSKVAVVDMSEHHCHPDFSLDEQQKESTTGSDYLQACVFHFGVTLKLNTRVIEMNEKYGGWVLTYYHAGTTHRSNEYFDFVVIADLMMMKETSTATCRFYEQFFRPSLLLELIIWGTALLSRIWNVVLPSKATTEQPRLNQPDCHIMVTPSHKPFPATYEIRSNPKLYRRMISPNVPRVAFLEQPDCASSAYLAGVWLSTVLYDEMDLSVDTISTMSSNGHHQLTLRYNDLLLQDLGINHLRKKTLWQEYFGTYTSFDYRGILHQVQERRLISRQEGWAVPLTPMSWDF